MLLEDTLCLRILVCHIWGRSQTQQKPRPGIKQKICRTNLTCRTKGCRTKCSGTKIYRIKSCSTKGVWSKVVEQKVAGCKVVGRNVGRRHVRYNEDQQEKPAESGSVRNGQFCPRSWIRSLDGPMWWHGIAKGCQSNVQYGLVLRAEWPFMYTHGKMGQREEMG